MRIAISLVQILFEVYFHELIEYWLISISNTFFKLFDNCARNEKFKIVFCFYFYFFDSLLNLLVKVYKINKIEKKLLGLDSKYLEFL